MYLGNPLLPVNTTVSSATDSIKKKLEAKNWHEYELKPLKLNLVPYFLFNYHYFVEDVTSSKSSIKSTIHGVLAIDGHDIVIREDLVELIKHSWKKALPEIPRMEFTEKWCNIEKREQDSVLQIKTAEYFSVPKENVFVSSARKFYLPLYKTIVIVDGKEHALTINALDGSIDGLKGIPERQKGYMELTKETVADLKKPSNWIKYSKEVLFETSAMAMEKISSPKGKEKSAAQQKKSSSKEIDLSFLDSKGFLLLIIILALLLIFMGIFRIKPF